jgi:hypothetical protein
MPPTYVKTYVKRQKNDMVDAEAICEAVQRPTKVAAVALANKMTIHGQRRALSRACCASVVTPRWIIRRDQGWEGRTDTDAGSGEPGSGTPHTCQSILECAVWVGAPFAKGIMASGHEHRSNRSNTWLMWTAPASQGCLTVF